MQLTFWFLSCSWLKHHHFQGTVKRRYLHLKNNKNINKNKHLWSRKKEKILYQKWFEVQNIRTTKGQVQRIHNPFK